MNREIDEIGIDDILESQSAVLFEASGEYSGEYSGEFSGEAVASAADIAAAVGKQHDLILPVQKEQKAVPRRFLRNLPDLPHFEDKAQKRAGGNIIKFLALLLVLTLIARGTGGATLTRVELSNPTRSEIVEAVTGSAVVSVRDSLDITAPEGLTVIEMLVGAGQTLNYGDAIALFDLSEVREKLERESAALDKLRLDMEKLDRTESADSASLQNATRNMRRAEDDYVSIEAQGESDISAAKEALEEVLNELSEDTDTAALESALRSLNRARDDYDAAATQGLADIASAQSALNDARDADVDSVDSNSLDNARRNRNREREDYAAVEAKVKAELVPAQSALDAAVKYENEMKEVWEADKTNTEAEQTYQEAQAETKKAREAFDEAKAKAEADAGLKTAKRRLEDAEASYDQALTTYNNNDDRAESTRQDAIDKARDAVESAQKRAEENLLSAARRVEDAEASFAAAEKNYSKGVDQVSDTRQNKLESAQKALESAEKKATENLLSAARRVEDAQTSLSAAERDYGRNTQQSSDTAAQNSVGAVTLELDIEDKKAVVDDLTILEANSGVLYTDIAGVVMSVKPDGSITGKDALVSFMDGAKGFEAKLQLDKSQSDKLAVGDECQVTTGAGSMYYTPTVNAFVSTIAPPDDQDRVQVTIRLPEGDWTAGRRVDVQAVQNRATYDLCVPLSAVRSDNTGYYLLTVEQESTVLGVANTVIRVPVTITAYDDDNAAVQGPVGRNSKIITGSNKAVAAGDRVRVNN